MKIREMRTAFELVRSREVLIEKLAEILAFREEHGYINYLSGRRTPQHADEVVYLPKEIQGDIILAVYRPIIDAVRHQIKLLEISLQQLGIDLNG